ncbi:hypothetical protein CAPTEDRAFT_170802 [Capitella teleta]|uniref:Protein kinase domain-containing protein n=1 Tax=Capitella teleta TaxID=283909 RepID=R7UV02_CAPTE|nr:hypothetical protein CAPTEDRAFT_170802 [Capitella teleta]|eukprot:ELU07767.1 hypothetical protein CAPTEDRAFT_170802 [Capitella teleta]
MESIGDFEYSKKDLIGHGAFAVVFKGRTKKKHDLTVAIKCITKKNLAKSQNLLSKEINILKELSGLKHDNVVALLDCKETSHHVYLIMEYCNGGDLADYLQAKGTLSEDTIASFLKQIAGAMKALNAKGIVHRDLKPQNILLCNPPGRSSCLPTQLTLKIADFGFARFLQDGVMAATLCGSPMYMAPEVIMSLQYDAKADLWSVGTIVYQCLTGRAPFQAQTPQQLKQFYERNANLQPNIPSGTSPDLKRLLYSLLKRDARDRISFDDFFVHPFVNPVKTCESPSSSPVPVPRSRSRSSLSDSPRMKTVNASPLSGGQVYASPPPPPPPVAEQKSAEPMETGSMTSAPRPVQAAARQEEPEDYVMVPENIPSDHSASFSSGHRPPSSARRRTSVPSPATASPSTPSPSRPSSLPGVAASPGLPSTQPIPVPSQVKAYEQIQRSIGNSCSPSSPAAACSLKSQPSPQGVPIPRKGSTGSVPSVGSMSPPGVQFCIGTPPTNTWRRNSVTPPASSPLHKQHSKSLRPLTTPLYRCALLLGASPLPTILGSPTKTPSVPSAMSTSNQHAAMVPYSASQGSLVRERTTSFTRQRTMSGAGDDGVPFAQSPPNMEGPIMFVAPELAEETLMDKEHNETVSKLNFILALVECIIEIAKSRSSPLSESVNTNLPRSQSHSGGFVMDGGHVCFVGEDQRRLEQLVLYVRGLQLLTSSIQLAKDEMTGGRLQPSNAVKNILHDMNDYYHQCLNICRSLHAKGVAFTPDPSGVTTTADKLIYSHAIEMCQTAALDELFGNPQECFRRYRSAQILLHSLAQQAYEGTDRELLNKYKESVEKRLFHLHNQGFIQTNFDNS